MSTTAPRARKPRKTIYDLFPDGIDRPALKALLPCQGCHYHRNNSEWGMDCKVINRCGAAFHFGVSPPSQLRWVESEQVNLFTGEPETVRMLKCSRYTVRGSKPRKARRILRKVNPDQLALPLEFT